MEREIYSFNDYHLTSYSAGIDITVYTKTHLYEKFGHIFFNITGIKVDFKISGLKLRLHNLFDGATLLGEFFFHRNSVFKNPKPPKPVPEPFLFFDRTENPRTG